MFLKLPPSLANDYSSKDFHSFDISDDILVVNKILMPAKRFSSNSLFIPIVALLSIRNSKALFTKRLQYLDQLKKPVSSVK